MLKKEAIISILKDEFKSGQQLALDRGNNILPDLSLLKTTSNSEWWVTQECPACKDSFREDDLVRICPGCKQAYHDDHNFKLHCWTKHFGNKKTCSNCNQYAWNGLLPDKQFITQTQVKPFPVMEEQFFAGLARTWQTYGNAKIYIVKQGDFIIGNTCPRCPFKIRLGDRVVKCPCSHNCTVYFHNDIQKKMTCWNDWNSGEKGKDYCPVSSRKYQKKTQFKLTD
jgi:hypothetical protein